MRHSSVLLGQQRRGSHGYAHLLGRMCDDGERNALLQHRAAFVYQRLEYATGVEPTAVVNNDRDLAQLGDVIERLGQRLFASLLAHDDFHQPHAFDWREENDRNSALWETSM